MTVVKPRHRPWFERWLRPPLVAALQALQNARRTFPDPGADR